MAVDRTTAEGIGHELVTLYAAVEARILAEVAARLAAGHEEPGWAQAKLAAVGDLRRWVQRLLAGLRVHDKVSAALLLAAARGREAALAEAERALRELRPDPGTNPALLAYLAMRTAEARQAFGPQQAEQLPGAGAIGRLAESLSDRLVGAHTVIVRWTVDAYRDVVARTATVDVLAGVATRRKASEQAWQELLDRGITGFVDRAGRRWNLATYVEMATRTSVAQATIEAHLDQLGTLGRDYVIVSDAPQECVLCRPFEGKVLSRLGPPGPRTVPMQHATRDGVTVWVQVAGTVAEAMLAGLLHPQCRHSLGLYLPGLTRIPTATADPAGDQARQQLRGLERKVRRAKMQQRAGLTAAQQRAAGAKVRALQAQIRAHVEATEHLGIRRHPEREQIDLGNKRR
ncbi:MAG TPA: phage minor capsid protein [Pseudonocardiaceae bacterium]|nr:phage minor capsid protein [Pseudonocardiaceae bacterium]